eukprot:scaffold7328_cov114-Cyclotella_meneghiniana.AAC.1
MTLQAEILTVNEENQTETQKSDDLLADHILNNLSVDQKEAAARASSYRHLVSTTDDRNNASTEIRDKYAKDMINRYLTVEQKLNKTHTPEDWAINAESKLKRTLEFFVENDVDAIRLCFRNGSDSELNAQLRDGLLKRFANGASIVRGYSKEGHALFQNFPRTETSWDEEFFIKGNIYCMEKALACTERRTNGAKDKVIVMYDYSGYTMKNSPPIALVRKLLFTLKDHFPERLEHVFVVDAPFIFRAFWAIVQHFIDPITKELVCFVSGEEAKRQILGSIIDINEASTWMFEGARRECDVDSDIFLKHTPFDVAYGEED